MALLELVKQEPDWAEALEVALTRPPGVQERRAGEDPWRPAPTDRPQRVSDDLAWLRYAVEEEDGEGLRVAEGTAAQGVWEPDADDALERLQRLEARGVLGAAGFLLHEPVDAEL